MRSAELSFATSFLFPALTSVNGGLAPGLMWPESQTSAP